MTDNEIIQAYEICINNGDCTGCPYFKKPGERVCFDVLYNDICDLAKRQQAEIKWLKRLAGDDNAAD